MRISKVLAAASAAALVASMGMTFVSADTTYTATKMEINTTKDGEKVNNISISAWGSQWVKCYDEALKDADMSKLAIHFVVESDGTYDEKDNIAFKVYGVNGDNDQGEVFYGVAGTKTYDFYYNLKDVKIDQYGGFGFNTQAGHRAIKLVSADMVAVGESTPSSSTADATSSTVAGDSSKADATSSTVAGDSSKADDTSKPADDKDLPVLSGVPYVFGDIEGNGKIRLELFNNYGDSKKDKTLADAFSKLAANKEIEVKFKLSGVPKGEYEAKLMFCDNDWKWNTMDSANPNPNKTVKVTGDGEYSVKLTAAEGAAVTNGAQVFCVDIDGLATALKIQTPKDATSALKQKLAMDAGLKVSDVKILVDGVEFDPTGSNNGGDKKDDNKGSSSVADGSSTTSTTSTNSTGTTSSKAANNASNTNPSTGAAALAAVGVALAGAAVVATKKRK